jgi:hypothetical protein
MRGEVPERTSKAQTTPDYAAFGRSSFAPIKAAALAGNTRRENRGASATLPMAQALATAPLLPMKQIETCPLFIQMVSLF